MSYNEFLNTLETKTIIIDYPTLSKMKVYFRLSDTRDRIHVSNELGTAYDTTFANAFFIFSIRLRDGYTVR